MTVNVYCTIFDAAYLSRALALHASLLEASPRARLAFFCIDEASSAVLSRMALERAIVVPHAEFATAELQRVHPQRSRAEYCWTCKPFALLHLARAFPDAPWLVYVDTDMMFFGDPDAALPTEGPHYLLTPHRFSPSFERYAHAAGRHNAGYVAIRNTPQGRQAAQWWAERCIESCSVEVLGVNYGDQRYLDQMLEHVAGGAASQHAGLNAAPWNIGSYRVSAPHGKVLVDGVPLLLYHFQALRILNGWLVDLYAGERRIGPQTRALIYQPYLELVKAAYPKLRAAQAPAMPASLRTPRDWLRLGYGLAHGRHNLARFSLS
ncbi:MAG: hypothetical protein ACREUO_04265 [Burkholderiales bacterium]